MIDEKQHPTELLPFYVNGTLTGEERDQVVSHIGGCATCQQELLLLQTMRESSKQEAPVVAEDFAWHRLKRDIRQKDNQRSDKNLWWKPAMATAAAIVIVVQTVFIFKMDSEMDSYVQAGHHEQSAVVQVKFNANAREEQIRKALLELDAEIIAGPSAAGVYRIKLTHLKDDPASEGKIKKLREHKLLINYLARE